MKTPDLIERLRPQYGDEYISFLLIEFSLSKACPVCSSDAIRKLWLGNPEAIRGDSIWGKWYLWCESCLRGIYCPLGTYVVPKDEPYIRWDDPDALKKALPPNLKLITPTISRSQEKNR